MAIRGNSYAELMSEVLDLQLEDSWEEGSDGMLLSDALWRILSGCQEKLETNDHNMVSEYVFDQMTSMFVNLGEGENNLVIDDPNKWKTLISLDLQDSSFELTGFAHILLHLSYLSIINAQQVSQIPNLKDGLWRILTQKPAASDVVVQATSELYIQILAVDCSPIDLINLYGEVETGSGTALKILNTLGNSLSDIGYQSLLYFDNAYKIFEIRPGKTQLCLQLWTVFNRVTSNRIFSLNNNIFVEIRESILCISDDEFVLAVFETFEFNTDVLYNISLNVNGDTFSLFVDGVLIETMAIPNTPSSERSIKKLELGSMICSFKVFKFWAWSEPLFETGIKLTYRLPFWDPGNSANGTGSRGKISDEFDVGLLQEVCASIETPGITMGLCAHHAEQLRTTHLLIRFVPSEVIDDSWRLHQKGYALVMDEDNSSNIGKMLCYKRSSLLSCFETICVSDMILSLIRCSRDLDDLYGYIDHWLILMQCTGLRHNFEEVIGYEFLSLFIESEVLSKLNTNLSLPFMNIILSFCGWNFDGSADPILRNRKACSSFLLNFRWWVGKNASSFEDPSIEIICFLFFQLREALESSKFAEYNYKQLASLQISSRLTGFLDEFYSNSQSIKTVDSIRTEVSDVMKLIIKRSSKAEVLSLFNFAFFEVKKGSEQSAALTFGSLTSALSENLLTEDEGSTHSIAEIFPVKLILMTIDVAHSTNVMFSGLKLLMGFLESASISHSRFVKNNGFRILYGIIKETDFQYYDNLIKILSGPNFPAHYSKMSQGFSPSSQKSGIKSDNHCIIIDLLEWAVLNDVKAYPLDTNKLICEYLTDLKALQEDSPGNLLFDAQHSLFLGKLLGLLMTLRKPQNTNTYVRASEALVAILTTSLLHHLSFSNPKKFGDQISNLLRDRGNKSNRHYVEQYYWISPFESVLEQLESFIPSFMELFEQSDFILSNVLQLLEIFTSSVFFTDLPIGHYLKSYGIATACIEWLTHRATPSKKTSTASGIFCKINYKTNVAFFSSIVTSDIGILSPNMIKFVDITLIQQSALFQIGNKEAIFDSEAVAFLLSALAWSLKIPALSDSQTAVLNCLRIIVLHHENILDSISNFIDRSRKETVLGSLLFSLSASDEDLLERLRSKDTRGAFETHVRKHIRKSEGNSSPHYSSRQELETKDKELASLKERENIVERRLAELDSMYKNFCRDGQRTSESVIAAEEKKRLYSLNDTEDELVAFCQRFDDFERRVHHRRRIQNSDVNEVQWTLDPMEDSNRMRKRLIPISIGPSAQAPLLPENDRHHNPAPEDQPADRHSERKASSAMSFELINDLDMLNLGAENSQDRNRKVLRMLQKGDVIKRIWNCSNVVGLSITEGVLILGASFVYFLSGFFYSVNDSKVVELCDAASTERDPAVKLVSGSRNKDEGSRRHEVQFWKISEVVSILKRPFLLRDSAIEISFDDGKSSFYTFRDNGWRNDAHHWLQKKGKQPKNKTILFDAYNEVATKSEDINIKNGLSEYRLTNKVANVFSYGNNSSLSFKALKLWRSGQISNFYYLIMLNTLAGRTFNDITQYPIFPWVIADYHSEELDLASPKTFRDLSKPMGAQSERRKDQFVERFDALKDLGEAEPPFHYGTHYSSAMVVSSFMIRLPPFVDSYLILQDGKFGHADRLFNSIERTWSSASRENSTDVRELIPEFFYLPEFLENVNGYNYGILQNGERVDNVILPPWAKNDPKLFVTKNRQALECPYVSQRLHHWIDLIFGFKQTGDAAVEAVNVFNRLSYPGAVNLDKIDDENERVAVTGIIHNFGQSPLRIFDQPHPKKDLQQTPLSSSTWSLSKLPKTPFVRDMHGNERLSNYEQVRVPNESTEHSLVSFKGCSIYIDEVEFLNAHQSNITSLKQLKGRQVCTADEFGLIKLWEWNKEGGYASLIEIGRLAAHLCSIKELHFSSQYNMLLSLDSAGNLYSWDTLAPQILRCFSREASLSAFSGTSATVLLCDKSSKVTICNLNGSIYIEQQFDTPISSASFLSVDDQIIGWLEEETIGLGFTNGEIKILALRQGLGLAAWELQEVKALSTEVSKPVTRLYIDVEGHQTNDFEEKRCQVLANNSDQLFVWTQNE
ncbi:LAFA_0G03620g1_1 [Lachancea sp. 'fantastica']|nr:LAFA_0G03620g1_1 [Lachancea sp. 'fantastica']